MFIQAAASNNHVPLMSDPCVPLRIESRRITGHRPLDPPSRLPPCCLSHPSHPVAARSPRCALRRVLRLLRRSTRTVTGFVPGVATALPDNRAAVCMGLRSRPQNAANGSAPGSKTETFIQFPLPLEHSWNFSVPHSKLS